MSSTFIDLFSGCGGFSLGLVKSGLTCVGAIDNNAKCIETFKRNHADNPVAIVEDLSQFTPIQFANLIKKNTVDLIVGGPPCQGFSIARKMDGSNTGGRLISDPRRDLYKYFLKYVDYFKPKIFVMENVLGIKQSQNGIYFTAIQDDARKIGYKVSTLQVNCWEYGVPQKRIRQLFFGTLVDLSAFDQDDLIKKTHSLNISSNLQPVVTLGEAIGDLPRLLAGQKKITNNYDIKTRNHYFKRYGTRFIYDVAETHRTNNLTWHVSRNHNERDLRDFKKLREGESSRKAIARGIHMEFPYDRNSFKDRYIRQARNSLCSTIVAHLKVDGLMFIHPTQNRSLTPREAARIQSFPDHFEFIGSRSDVFSQIGNAVPPLLAQCIGRGITKYLKNISKESSHPKISNNQKKKITLLLEEIIDSSNFIPITTLSKRRFIEVWKSVHLLLPHLHPESAKDNGSEISLGPKKGLSHVFEPYYIRSGWPVELVFIAQEAYRRLSLSLISRSEYFNLN
jgi:DNA (cytosine-5)-methyltransferase 1